MKRRAFIKTLGLGGAAVYVPATLTMTSLLNQAYAASPDYKAIDYTPPSVFPQVINIFLYGGPSELAGNLTNMLPNNGNLDARSEVSYSSQLGDEITRLANDDGGLISKYGFWLGAGGNAMDFLLDNQQMTVYRTMMQRKGDTQSHRDSIFMNQKGTMDLENSPGMGTRIAKTLETAIGLDTPIAALGNKTLSNLILPFVSFEGETVFYAPDTEAPVGNLNIKPITMRFSADEGFENPYERFRNENGPALDALVKSVETAETRSRFSKVRDGFLQRTKMEGRLNELGDALKAPLPLTSGDDQLDDFDADTGRLVYPDGTFSDQIRAAVTLAIENPETLFITVSNGGLGGFDDHNNGTDNYPERMENLFNSLRAAMKHIKYSNGTTPGGLSRSTGNIIINVFGDFGRRANLNNSLGWDHGNCQVLYTLGGANIRSGGINALGKVVGTTKIEGASKSNDQYLVPTDNSYEFEPMSFAASIYRYFGVQNTQVLTKDPVYHLKGHSPINEGVAGEGMLF